MQKDDLGLTLPVQIVILCSRVFQIEKVHAATEHRKPRSALDNLLISYQRMQ